MTKQLQRIDADAFDEDAFDENGILKDGHTYRVPLRLCDSAQRQVAAYAAGMTSGRLNRPGFARVSDAVRDLKNAEYDRYEKSLQDAWMNAPPSLPTGFGSREFGGTREGDSYAIKRKGDTATVDTREAAYSDYDEYVRNAWCGGDR